MQPKPFFAAYPDQFRSGHTQCKGKNRHQIVQKACPVPGKEGLPHKNDVACLRIGKDTAASQVGVGVLQAAGKRQKQHRAECLGHLPGFP